MERRFLDLDGMYEPEIEMEVYAGDTVKAFSSSTIEEAEYLLNQYMKNRYHNFPEFIGEYLELNVTYQSGQHLLIIMMDPSNQINEQYEQQPAIHTDEPERSPAGPWSFFWWFMAILLGFLALAISQWKLFQSIHG